MPLCVLGDRRSNDWIAQTRAALPASRMLKGKVRSQIAAVELLKGSHRSALAHLDALFVSLQHCALRGEL